MSRNTHRTLESVVTRYWLIKQYNVHLGDEMQMVDDIMAKYLDAGTIPAYCGMP